MPSGSLIMVTLSSSLVPMIPIHIYIKKITEKHIYIYIYIYIRKSEKGLDENVMSKMQVLHSTPPKDRSSYTLSKIIPLKIIILISY